VVSEFESVWGPRGMQDDGFHRGHFFPFNRVLSVGFYLKGVVGIYYMICGEMDDGSYAIPSCIIAPPACSSPDTE
jgi:hypothetical protein